ncbi:MAG TPA: ribonuclease domain-containing protein [Oxalicibacterium sp.]|nr:ribonuclease domain-containing protein [Oxalicibacterium sp.]
MRLTSRVLPRFLPRLLFITALLLSYNASAFGFGELRTVRTADLPPQARQTILLIRQGGPFPYEKDGAVFGNYEKVLPQQKRGYYREFTVKTPRARNRGARRIVAGGQPPHEYFYTADHYRSFKRVID